MQSIVGRAQRSLVPCYCSWAACLALSLTLRFLSLSSLSSAVSEARRSSKIFPALSYAVNDFLVSQSIPFFLLCAIYALCDYAQSAESTTRRAPPTTTRRAPNRLRAERRQRLRAERRIDSLCALCDYAQSAANANLERSAIRRTSIIYNNNNNI